MGMKTDGGFLDSILPDFGELAEEMTCASSGEPFDLPAGRLETAPLRGEG